MKADFFLNILESKLVQNPNFDGNLTNEFQYLVQNLKHTIEEIEEVTKMDID